MIRMHPIEHGHSPVGLQDTTDFGSKPVRKLIVAQAVPAGVGILAMSLNTIVDTIFVGNWIGTTAIAAITVVMPIVFLVASVGMAIGIGGSSMISRAIGANDKEKAYYTFGSQMILSIGLAILLAILGFIFADELLTLFGANGAIFESAKTYYSIVMIGAPLLAFTMTSNSIIRAEGKPMVAMMSLMLPAVMNILLDYLLIFVFDLGLAGAAWASVISYMFSFVFVFLFFLSDYSELKIKLKCLTLKKSIVTEIFELGSISFARQGVISLLAVILNHTLFMYGGEVSIAVYGIISRMLMFSLFPVMGIMQGFMPIAGYNYGAKNYTRLKETISKSILYATGLASLVFVIIMAFPELIVSVFSEDETILTNTPNALRIVFAVTPLITIQLIGSAYFQSIGKVLPALFLTLTKQGFFLIPLILILPKYWGILGVWMAFPIADLLSIILTSIFLRKELNQYI